MRAIRLLVVGFAAFCCAQAQASVEITSFTVAEQATTATVMATLRTTGSPPASIAPVFVDFVTQDGTAQDENGSGDYVSTAGTLEFTSFNIAQSISVQITGEGPDEHFFVNLFFPDSVNPDAVGRITIEGEVLNVGLPAYLMHAILQKNSP